jgi:hypothetical protein
MIAAAAIVIAQIGSLPRRRGGLLRACTATPGLCSSIAAWNSLPAATNDKISFSALRFIIPRATYAIVG